MTGNENNRRETKLMINQSCLLFSFACKNIKNNNGAVTSELDIEKNSQQNWEKGEESKYCYKRNPNEIGR